TVTEVRGHGKQKGHTAIYRGQEYQVTLLPKMEIEVVVQDHLAESACAAIITAARTGEIGDGRVFVMPVERTYSIRTGGLGEEEVASRSRWLDHVQPPTDFAFTEMPGYLRAFSPCAAYPTPSSRRSPRTTSPKRE